MNNSKKSNHLQSHSPERTSHRADKMSGWFGTSEWWIGHSKKFIKRFSNKKRRQLFKQNTENKF